MIRTDLKKKGLAIVNAYDVLPSVAHFLGRMKEELGLLGIELETRSTAEIYVLIGRDGNLLREELPYDFILYLDKDRYIAKMLESTGIRLFNKAHPIEVCDDKMETYLNLLGHGIHMPRTVSGPLHYSLLDNGEFFANLVKVLPFPIVAKANYGSQGDGVYLAQDMEELQKTEEFLAYKPRLYQEFISTASGFDYRLIIINGKFVAGYVRKNTNGDFRSNLAQGGKGIRHTMNPAQIALAEKVAKLIGLDYCGIDLLDSGDPDDPILCEVNSNAFIKGAEAITGINIAKAYAEHIRNTIYTE